MKVNAICPSCSSPLPRSYCIRLIPHWKYPCPQCGKPFRADPLREYFVDTFGAILVLLPVALASLGMVSWVVPVVALVLVLLLMLVCFPYLTKLVSADDQIAKSVEEQVKELAEFRRDATFVMVATFLFALLAAAVLFGFIEAGGVLDGKHSVLRTRILHVIGEDDEEFVSICGFEDTGGYLAVKNANGQTILSVLASDEGGAYLTLNNSGGEPAFLLTTSNEGNSLSVCNAEGTPVAAIQADKEGAGSVAVHDKQGAFKKGLSGSD